MAKIRMLIILITFTLLCSCNQDFSSSFQTSNNIDATNETLTNQEVNYDLVLYSTTNECETCFEYELSDDNTYKIVDIKKEYAKLNGTIYIPLTHNGKQVSRIEETTESNAKEVIFPETFKEIIDIRFIAVEKLILPRYLESIIDDSHTEYSNLIELTLPQKCQKFYPLRLVHINTLRYPDDCTTLYLPATRNIKQIIIPKSTENISDLLVNDMYYENHGIVEVYCFANLSDDIIQKAIPSVKIIKRSLDTESNIVKVNNILFYVDNADVICLGAYTSINDIMKLPKIVAGKKYKIEQYCFFLLEKHPMSIVIPKGITSIAYKAFYECEISDLFFEDEELPSTYHEKLAVRDVPDGCMNPDKYKITYHMAGTWGYVNGVPVVSD